MREIMNTQKLLLMSALMVLSSHPVLAQNAGGKGGEATKAVTETLGLNGGYLEFDTPDFHLKLVRNSQTVAALQSKPSSSSSPVATEPFDFTPGDILAKRATDGNYHLGDLDLRVRTGDSGAWQSYSTAQHRKPVLPLPTPSNGLASADLSPTLPADCPLQITRSWCVEKEKGAKGARLALRFMLKNRTDKPVEIGALGIPMIFDNIINDRTLDEAHARCVFYDPYIGEDAGYLQVTRLSGHGPALLVVPDGKTPFEAYNPILNSRTRPGTSAEIPIFHDPTPRGMTFEGFYTWMIHSKAYAEDEWKNATPWNPPTSLTLAPGQSKTYGLRFLLSDSIRHLEPTLAANARPVAVGIPGYVLPMDIDGKLFLHSPQAVRSLTVEPAGAIAISNGTTTPQGWKSYTLHGKTWGRARLVVRYASGETQAIHYRVIKPEATAVSDMGHFLMTRQWFVDPNDPFHRSPSVMSYDRERNQIVTQDSRAWISGLGDEGGSGSWLAAVMKEFGQPDKAEIEKYQEFIDRVVWGGLQYSEGPKAYGVRKSLFYYQPDAMPADYYRKDLDWRSWTSWNRQHSELTDRSFNYPHVAALHWVMYRLARNHVGLVTNHPWDWYLNNAYQTTLAMLQQAEYYTRFGQMEGDVFLQILLDLKREGMTAQATDMEAKMRARADLWRSQAYPFGSEMPWDSTGQEEVYAWTRYFGDTAKAQVTLDAILGYMPTLPHWGYNGSARRYWDFLYGGKLSRIERQLHHYGSGINAIPVLSAYREHPEDYYLLRVGYGGTMGALTNIDEEGFASAAFHSFPDTLKFDALSGDYGPNFFGHALNTATYLIDHPEYGWQSFGGNVEEREKGKGKREKGKEEREEGKEKIVQLTPLDSFRNRVYLAPVGLWLTLDAGQFAQLELSPATHRVRVGLSAATPYTPVARLRLEQPAHLPNIGTYHPASDAKTALKKDFKIERDAYVVPLERETTWITLTAQK